MKCLVTGGCGFAGTNLADAWLASGHEVTTLDNMSRNGAAENLAWLRTRHGSDWRHVRADVRDADAVADLVRELRPDAIAHLAGQVAMTVSLADPRLDFEVNAFGTFNVLDAARRHSPGSVMLYSSSNKVYGDLERLRVEETETRYTLPDYPNGLDETLPLDGHSPYGCSKLAADQYFRDFHRMYGLRTVVFRHSTMYGSRQFATVDQGWIGWFCLKGVERLRNPNAEPFTISGTGKQVRDVLNAADVITLYTAAVEQADVAAGQIYNIGGGMAQSLSLLELFGLLEKQLGARMVYRRLAPRSGDQRVFVADCRHAERDLGWRPRVSAREGIAEMLAWRLEAVDSGLS